MISNCKYSTNMINNHSIDPSISPPNPFWYMYADEPIRVLSTNQKNQNLGIVVPLPLAHACFPQCHYSHNSATPQRLHAKLKNFPVNMTKETKYISLVPMTWFVSLQNHLRMNLDRKEIVY
ncbi:hypothetical protein EYC84_006337 [Monilinia fructicola]|uniref:Uncharacterized protein n=1 Tax=Monilinia fructicola TaxID=38448 RepID=A0A5M9K7X8_MONFR|nr:hypothetical protein EYC84_006337 [Monilinia fructicola]